MRKSRGWLDTSFFVYLFSFLGPSSSSALPHWCKNPPKSQCASTPVASMTTSIPTCISNPDLYSSRFIVLTTYFTPESLKHKHLNLTNSSHFQVIFNFFLSITLHIQLITENQQSCNLTISHFHLHYWKLSYFSISMFVVAFPPPNSSPVLNHPLHQCRIIFLTH